jgi:hypothetical protein
VNRARERALEGQLLNTFADVAFKMAADIAEDDASKVTLSDFMRALRRKFVEGSDPDRRASESRRAFDWASLGRTASSLVPFPPQRETLLSALQFAPQKKQQRKQQKKIHDDEENCQALRSRNAKPPEEEPDEVDHGNTTTEIDQHLQRVYSNVRGAEQEGNCSCTFVDAVGSGAKGFGDFVENAFALSHLVKGGHCTLKADNSTLTTQIRQAARTDEQSAPRHAFVLSFNISQYEALFGESNDRDREAERLRKQQEKNDDEEQDGHSEEDNNDVLHHDDYESPRHNSASLQSDNDGGEGRSRARQSGNDSDGDATAEDADRSHPGRQQLLEENQVRLRKEQQKRSADAGNRAALADNANQGPGWSAERRQRRIMEGSDKENGAPADTDDVLAL